MKMKQKSKRFWNLSVHNHEGFTLVELIIVIAILAILSSVAVAGYSAYIEKANVAADEALLYEINLAFQTACIEAGVDITSLTNATAKMPIKDDGTIDMASVEPAGKVCENFAKYFDVANAKFKVVETLIFDVSYKKFVDSARAGEVKIAFGNGYITLNSEQIAALQNSTFKDIGMGSLLDRVDAVAGIAAAIDNDALAAVMGSDDYLLSIIGSLGGDTSVTGDAIVTEYVRVLDSVVDAQIAKELGVTVEQLDKNSDEYKRLYEQHEASVSKNLTVLYAAKEASSLSTEQVMAAINSDTPKTDLKNAMLGTSGEDGGAAFANVALVYAAFTAYANSSEGTAEAKEAANSANLAAVFNYLEDNDEARKDFQDYMDSPQGQKDLEASLAAMGMVSGSADDMDALTNALLNNYNSDEMKDIVDDLVGAG